MKKDDQYDVFVIGAGPGGYSAAILAAKKRLRVGIAEGSRIGGTCTNTGCIPTKTYIESVNLLANIRNASKFGIEVGTPKIDFSKVKARKDRIVTRLAKGIEYLLKHNHIDVYAGMASIPEPGAVRIGDTVVKSRNTIIATGSRPKKIPVFQGIDHWTSNEIFDITDLPESLAIIGGGVIGMEMAHIFSELDVKVTVIEVLDRILPLEDRHVSEYIAKIYRKIGIFTSSKVVSIKKGTPHVLVIDTPGRQRTVEAEKILVCTGREPVLPAGIFEPALARSPSGGIRVDEFMQTSIPGIYAVGDVTGEYMYAYVASREAEIAIDHITGGTRRISYCNIPSIIFTNPEIASVGMRKDNPEPGEHRIGTFPVSALGRARTMEANDGYAHISSNREGAMERISIVSPHATELIPWATLAVNQGLTAEEFLAPYYPHPVLAEIVKEAAEDITGMSVHHP